MAEMELAPRDLLQKIERFLWAAVLVALPVTSFRYLPFMGSDTQVRPLSLIPAVLLLFALIIRCIRERRLLLWSRLFLPLDRKSTRLNSSHANISYAVFCLKY